MTHILALALVTQTQTIHIDPLQIVEAQEVWSIIGSDKNPVWPGWNARKTPILIYFPGKQEVLINHPNPPKDFVKYEGAFKSTIGSIYIRNGKTTFDLDGQNTSTDINGVETLVVADTQSTKRQWIASIADSVVKEPSKANATIERGIFGNSIDGMTMFAHEAFHVYQKHMAPKKGGNDLALARYPTLLVENNVWLALEADYLGSALNATNPEDTRKQAIKWLASRQTRRAAISKEAGAYEDGIEFSEGTAKYIEYRTLQCLETKKPSADMWLRQGFAGYNNLSEDRARLVRSMKGFMSGTSLVNNDPYGASPVRFRLYYSGMAVGALLDKLGSKWHDRMLKTDATLTGLATEALHASTEELNEALKEIRTTDRYTALRTEKEKLAQDGAAHIKEVLAKFTDGPGEVVLDYSGMKAPKIGFSFTAFGILAVDDDRTIFRLIPIRGIIGDLSFSEDASRPILHDSKAKKVHLQLTEPIDAGLIQGDGTVNLKDLALPGVTLRNVKGKLVIEGKRLTIQLAD